MGVLGWIIFGLVVGVVAKLMTPGRDPGGFIVTILIGIAGALLGGYLGKAAGWYREGDPVGFVVAVTIDAIVVAIPALLVKALIDHALPPQHHDRRLVLILAVTAVVLAFADAMLFVCALVNILGLYLLYPEVSRMLREYQADRRSGVVRPVKDREPIG